MLTGNGDASVEDGIEWLLADRWSAGRALARRVGGPQDRDDEIVARARTASG